MHDIQRTAKELRGFLVLWFTQAISSLGSSMTSFALIVWSYQKQGSALTTSLLSVCSYAPYVVMSIFSGALSDRWNKKVTMLLCDSIAALTTVAVLVLLSLDRLEIWHLYVINAINGLMNTVQKPAADVSVSLLTPKEHYQTASALQSLSNSLVTIFSPVLATMFLSFFGIQAVLFFDLATFAVAFLVLLVGITIPRVAGESEKQESLLASVRGALSFLREHRGVLDLMLFLAAINLTASMYNAALPAMLLSRSGGGTLALGTINTVTGLTMLLGSIIASFLPPSKSRVRVICNTLLLSMSTENFFLAFARSVPLWSVGAFLGWIVIPTMNANMDVLMRSNIPVSMQGRVFSARNTLQFFTIPLGYLLGGFLVDRVCEPLMASLGEDAFLHVVFGQGKGTRAALLFLALALSGVLTCLLFRRDPHIWELEKKG